MAHVSPLKRLEKTAQFIRLAMRQIQENTPEQALRTLNNAANEVTILAKDGKTNEQLETIADQLIDWHKDRMDGLEILNTHADKPIDLGEGEPLQLKPEQIKGFRIAVILCQSLLSNFPLKVIETLNTEEM